MEVEKRSQEADSSADSPPSVQPVRPQESGASSYVWTVEYLWNVDRLRREGWQATAPVSAEDTRGAYHLRRAQSVASVEPTPALALEPHAG